MSEAASGREWRFYLDDMIGFCERVQVFTAGIDQAQFIGDPMHGYLGVDNDTLWSIVETDIPMLLTSLRDLKAKLAL